MLYIDKKYIGLISYKLRNFKEKKQNYWNFACPICGDSKTNALKARGYVFLHQGRLVYKCHNCSYSSNVGNLIKHVDPNVYNEYVLERYKENMSKHNDHVDLKETTLKLDIKSEPILYDAILDTLQHVETLPESHIAKQYLINRKIPKDQWKLFYYVDKFKEWSNQYKFQFMNLDHDHPRLIIPFFDKHGKVFMYQGRALNGEEPKYISVKLDDKQEKVYGLERIDYSKRVYIVEGPIDSIFLPNGIAVGGADFDIPFASAIKSNVTLVSDNEPRNKEIVKMIGKFIDKGYDVCLWPDTIKEKDINEMVLSGKTSDQILQVINDNTYSGMTAKLKYSTWKKV